MKDGEDMKKYFSLCFTLAVFSISFICFWFYDVLMNRRFPFGIIPGAFILYLLTSGLVVSVACIAIYCKAIQNYIALAISVITIVMPFVFPFRDAKVHLEFPIYEKDRLAVIEMVKNEELTVDHIGNAELPKGYRNLSSDGEIFIFQNDEEQVVAFWVFRGMLSGSVQLIYSSQDEALIYANETGHPITSVTRLKDHWYLVDTDY